MNKNNKKIEIIAFIVLVALILGLALTLYLRRNSSFLIKILIEMIQFN